MKDAAPVHERPALVGLRSRKHIAPFVLERPTSVAEAHAARKAGPRAAFMAGGIDLIDRMKNGEVFDRVIHLDRITSLHGIVRISNRVTIGALAPHSEIEHSRLLSEAVVGLPALWREIANPRVRHAGTIGGNLMSALPHYDAAPALLALNAEATLSNADGFRAVAIDAIGDRPGALLESLSFSAAPMTHLLADRSLHPVLSVYLGARSSESGTLVSARVAIGCAFPRPRAVDLPVTGKPLHAITDDAANLADIVVAALPPPIADGVASGAYCRRMIAVLTRRLLIRLGACA
jgi:aerobic carbon-monoxide dehydrogenase medium subunit